MPARWWQGRPGIAIRVNRTGDEKRQLRVEEPMLFDQMVADEAPTDIVHLFGNADLLLDFKFAFMPWRLCDNGGLYAHRHDSLSKGSGCSCQADRRLDEWDEAEKLLYPGKPGADIRIGRQINISFRRAGGVAVNRNIGDCDVVCRKPRAL